MNPKIKLRPAYAWDCSNCGHTSIVEQFFNTLRKPEESEHGIGHYECGPIHNGYVFCDRCETKHEVEIINVNI